MILKALLLWSCIVPLAVANGVLREKVLLPRLGLRKARGCSGVLLAAVIFAFTMATIGWLPHSPPRGYVFVGACWVVWTVLFEVVFGRYVAKKTWRELGDAYSFKDGDLWPAVLVVVGASPYLAAVVRGILPVNV